MQVQYISQKWLQKDLNAIKEIANENGCKPRYILTIINKSHKWKQKNWQYYENTTKYWTTFHTQEDICTKFAYLLKNINLHISFKTKNNLEINWKQQ